MIRLYLDYRHSIGDKITSATYHLNSFAKSLDENLDAQAITKEQSMSFVRGDKQEITKSWFHRHVALNGLCKWAFAREYISCIPLSMETPKHPKSDLPYIYTDEELKRIFEYAGSDSLHTTSLYPGTLKYVLHMTYVMGLRISEMLSLRVSNVNMKESYIEIIDSKRHKSRLVPFNRQVYRLITKRMRWRVLSGMANDPDTPFWLNKRGIQLTASTIKNIMRK